jgi:glucarate dehydratase
MKVVKARLTRVRLPLSSTFVSSQNMRSEVVRTLIRLYTDQGLIGLGEAAGSPEVFALATRLCEQMLGKDPLDRERLRRSYGSRIFQNMNGRNGWIAMGGVEIACWDLAAKRHGLPLYELLGGAWQKRIPIVCEMSAVPLPPNATPADVEAFFAAPENADKVVEAVGRLVREHGYRAIKLKSPARSLEWDVRVMSGARAIAGTTVQLRHDPNAAYSLSDALTLCKRLDDLGLQWFEDPATGIDSLRRIRREVRTPVATNMAVIQFDQIAHAVRLGAVDIIGADAFHWGGITSFTDQLAVCDAFGIGVFLHSFTEFGVGTAANLHLAAASRSITTGVDSTLYQQPADILAGGPLRVVDGCIAVPEGPGLGVEIDEAAVARASVEDLLREL